jgi:hypothetical protein
MQHCILVARLSLNSATPTPLPVLVCWPNTYKRVRSKEEKQGQFWFSHSYTGVRVRISLLDLPGAVVGDRD